MATSKPVIIETLATGDEVVNGDVADTNSAYVSSKLSRLGILTARHTALPDDETELEKGLREISARARYCVCSGGLGPTEDDLTTDVASRLCGVEPEIDSAALAKMKVRFEKMGYRLTDNNLRSVRVPRGSQVFQNDVGTAPAYRIRIGGCDFFFLPGVPKEFRFFCDRQVIGLIAQECGGGFGAVVQLKTLGWGESHLAEKFEDFGKRFPEIKVGYRAHAPEVWLKLTSLGASHAESLHRLRPAVEEARARLGLTVFGEGDQELPEIIHSLLLEKGLSLALAESCTGGLLASLLTRISGSSGYLQGSAVTYSNAAKSELLGVSENTLAAHGAVSPETASEMARGAVRKFGAQLALSITGIAGPGGGTSEKPVGLVYLALAARDGTAIGLKRNFRGDRERVQKASALTSLEMLRRYLIGAPALADGPG